MPSPQTDAAESGEFAFTGPAKRQTTACNILLAMNARQT